MSASPMPRRQTDTGWSIRWDPDLARTANEMGLWRRETLASTLRSVAAETPDRVLVVDGDRHLTAGRMLDRAETLAKSMLARFAPGSVVSFMLPNWIESTEVYHAIGLAGMVAHPILPSLRDQDLRFILADTDCRMIFAPAEFRGHDYGAMLSEVISTVETPPEVVLLRGDAGPHKPYSELFEEAHLRDLPHVDPDDVRMIMYTSGTTGRPKGVLHSHNSIGALIAQLGEHWLIDPGDPFLVASPVSHIGGSIYAFEMPVMLGSTAHLMERWDPKAAVETMAEQGCTHMAGATPFLQELLDASRATDTRLPELKVFICGGASVPPRLIREASAWFHPTVVTRVYGSTEVPVMTVGAIDASDIEHAAETDGRPGLATLRLGSDGEIRARAPQMFVGYIHPEDEADAFDDEGFYRTGDQGRWVEGGYLVVTGRIKDLIIRSGENISPKEVEDLLIDHPDVAEIAIVGVPDIRTGERAVAVIVPEGEARPGVESLSKYLSARGVARFKHPESVLLRHTLPKNDAGKVLKQTLRTTISN